MQWLFALTFVGILLVYVFIVRPFLEQSVVLSPVFKAEASLVLQLRAKLAGWKTKIASRVVVISGVLVGLYDQALPLISGQDWTPLSKRIPDWSIPVGLVLIGWLFSYLRKVTENPPQVITQKIDGVAQVVAVNNAPAA